MSNEMQTAPQKWEYTAQDFLETTAPYEELARYAGNPFLHQRMVELMSKYATSVGFRGMKLMYKRYRESIKSSSGSIVMDNPTKFDGQPLELNAGDHANGTPGQYRHR